MEIVFFEIPCSDLERAMAFYRNVFGQEFSVSENGAEKMAFFPEEGGRCPGVLFYSPDFKPGEAGVLISFGCDSLPRMLEKVLENGGCIVIPETPLFSDTPEVFAVFRDSEGNRIGLYAA